ncbi:MAG: phenylacetate--CoA ligase family protein [Planctomycetota bacterium]
MPISRQHLRNAAADELADFQLKRLNDLLRTVIQRPFYRQRLEGLHLPLRSLDQLAELPLLTKSDLAGNHHRSGQPASLFDLPASRYVRLHQTSGTSGHPLPVLDTREDWRWWIECWQYVLDAADVTEDDVAMMAFSFGPFIGFWTAHDALVDRGATVVPGGGLSSEARLKMIADLECTLVCCTPTYALHLASVAKSSGMDLPSLPVTRLIVAGEPGGSIAAIRSRIQDAWGATVVDHSGASEVGAWGFGSRDGQGLHVIESEFIAECLQFSDQHPGGLPAAPDQPAELVLTSLGRVGGPAIRYRTGDMVRASRDHSSECRFLWLRGGVAGRTDDMMVIRGVNVFPSSIEAIVREVDATAEFRMVATRQNEMDQLDLEAELEPSDASRLEGLLKERLAMRVSVQVVPLGTLPRFQAKSRRWVDRRESTPS